MLFDVHTQYLISRIKKKTFMKHAICFNEFYYKFSLLMSQYIIWLLKFKLKDNQNITLTLSNKAQSVNWFETFFNWNVSQWINWWYCFFSMEKWIYRTCWICKYKLQINLMKMRNEEWVIDITEINNNIANFTCPTRHCFLFNFFFILLHHYPPFHMPVYI